MQRILCGVFVLLAGSTVTSAQDFSPPDAKVPDAATKAAIGERTRRLSQSVLTLQRLGIRDPFLADVEIYLKAAQWIDRHGEYYHEQSGQWTLDVLDRGLLRASQAMRGESPWYTQTGQSVVRAYRSRIDGSLQPYSVTLPREYGRDPRVNWRLDVVLHGRDKTLTEVKFLQQHNGNKPSAVDSPYVTLEIYGRGNNAYRWAGESDVLEAIESFVATERAMGRDLIDPKRVVLRGFSMGGAGTWHLGLHRPDRWCVIGPGAGFSTTRGYVKDLPDPLPAHIADCLHIYDAVDYAPNAFNVPVVAYAGDKDPQLQAARNIEAVLKPLNVPMTLLVGQGLEHQFPPEWQKKAEVEYLKYAAPGKGRKDYPDRVWFTTYTLKYAGCDWVELLGLDRHFDKAVVDATRKDDGFEVKTTNVRAVRLSLPGGDTTQQLVRIDGQEVPAQPAVSATGALALYLEKRDGKWASVLPQRIQTDRLRRLQKIGGLQGPIDDAFTDAFLCVRGSGTPWHETTRKYAEAELNRFKAEWDRFFRGALTVKIDTDVTDEDLATRNIILFGDPASNSLIAQILPSLPLKWTRESIGFAGQTFETASHVPVMVYPSPLNVARYVVLNSGHTFRARDLVGTNALLFPRLGDFAVVKPAPTEKEPSAAETILVGLFDEWWQVPPVQVPR